MNDEDAVTEIPNPGYDRRIRAFRCGTTVDSFAVVTTRFLILIDTLVNPETMEAVMAKLTDVQDRPLLVVNTHGDWDHVWGNGLFAGPDAPYPAPVIGTRLAAEKMRSERANNFLREFKREHPGRYDSAEFWPPTVQFEGELTIDGGDLTLQLIPTPGHTADHVSVWIPEIRTVFAGDAAELPMPFVSDPMALPTLRSSLELLLRLDPQTVLYCHAPGVHDARIIRSNIDYFDELERRGRGAIAAGQAEDLLASDADTAAVIGWPLEDALPPGVSLDTIPTVDFYRRFHAVAIGAMITWLQSPR